MRTVFVAFIFVFLISSCIEKNTHHQNKSQDSLLNILHTQITELKQLPKYKKNIFLLNDSLSSADSILYQNILINYNKSITTMDSIQTILPQIFSESDSLFKYTELKDTLILHRLKYLTNLNKGYIREYYKSMSIAEQNQGLLNMFSKSSQ